jgi:hypothetical protein
MPAIFFTNAMIMGPAKMMDHASVILDSLAVTVPVNSQRPFMIEAGICCCLINLGCNLLYFLKNMPKF